MWVEKRVEMLVGSMVGTSAGRKVVTSVGELDAMWVAVKADGMAVMLAVARVDEWATHLVGKSAIGCDQ